MNTLSGNVHLVAGDSGRVDDVLKLLGAGGVQLERNPDLYVREYRSFGIDDAHELRTRAATHAFGARRVFIIVVDSMTSESQNALLKTLEEPAGDTLFFFIVPSPETLLPTLRSRAQTLDLDAFNPKPTKSRIEVEQFLRSSATQRIDMIKPLLEKGEDEKRDLGAMLAFLAAIERSLSKLPKTDDIREGSQALYRARMYIGDRGALVKPLLEQVALLVPQI